MGFRILILTEGIADVTHGPVGERSRSYVDELPKRLEALVPDVEIDLCRTTEEAEKSIASADAAFGVIGPELLREATRLRWIMSPVAGPKAGYYHASLVESDVVVTNMREIYSDHIGAHIMAFVLAFARGLHVYLPRQTHMKWEPGTPVVHLPEATALVVGVGGIGAEAARLCAAFGMTVIGVDGRREEPPEGVAELLRPDALASVLPQSDFVIVTVPETPETQGMFGASLFRTMKRTAFFINIGRGATVVLDDLNDALRAGEISGAALDVFEIEPLPADHPLWDAPGMIITPHVAGAGPYLDERRAEVFLDNCVRFNEGRPLRNVVDKARWF